MKLYAVAIIVASLCGVTLAVNQWGPRSLPTCDSDLAQDTLKKAFDGSQAARTLNLSAVMVSGATETSYDNGRRKCSAALFLNNTSGVAVDYELAMSDSRRFLLTFKFRV